MDTGSDPEVAEFGMIKPSQCGGTEIGLAWMGWIIDTDPDSALICQPDQTMARIFSKTRLKPMIDETPAVKKRMMPQPDADSVDLKLFRGMPLACVWPVPSQFTQRPARYAWADDSDQYPEDIGGSKEKGGQGSILGLIDGRGTSFEGREKKFMSSSPAREDGGGIEAFVASGTDERLQPRCPSCGERWEIDILRDLKFDESGSAEDAEQSAHVICGTGNGCILQPTDRRALLDSLIELPHRGFVAANPAAGKFRRTFRIDGLMALTSWPRLARQWRAGQISWATRQDESDLRTFYNTKAGKNYRSIASGEKPIVTNDLKKRLESDWKLGTVPRGPAVLNIVVDVQHDRFEVGTIGYGRLGERWLIDRFAIDVLDDGLTQVRPFTHHEHWEVLLGLFSRKYPLAELGEDGKPVGYAPILSITIDTGGSSASGDGDKRVDQATEGAKSFWNSARALGIHPSRITLVKGGSNPKGKDLMPKGQFADQKRKGGAKKTSAQLFIPNVHKIKNIVDAKLRRPTPGPGYYHLPGDLSDEHLDEATAEELQKGKWKKLRPRNETLDIMVYGEAAILRPPFAQSRTDLGWIGPAFRIRWPDGPAKSRRKSKPDTNDNEPISPAQDALAEEATQSAPPKAALRRAPRKRSSQNPYTSRNR